MSRELLPRPCSTRIAALSPCYERTIVAVRFPWLARILLSLAVAVGCGGNNGPVREFATPTPRCGPYGIASGPDGALWFTEQIGKIGRVTSTGAFTEYSVTRGVGVERARAGAGFGYSTSPRSFAPRLAARWQ